MRRRADTAWISVILLACDLAAWNMAVLSSYTTEGRDEAAEIAHLRPGEGHRNRTDFEHEERPVAVLAASREQVPARLDADDLVCPEVDAEPPPTPRPRDRVDSPPPSPPPRHA